MKKVLLNYGGTILFYLVIFVGVVLVSNKISYIESKSNNITPTSVTSK